MPDTHITIPMARLIELETAEQERDIFRSERLDMALLVGRLIRRMRAARTGKGMAAGDDALEQQCIGYLRRKGLTSPLREEGPNARLIAAAPDLLAALREAADLRAALCRGSEGGDPTTWDAPLNRWLAAIARAEGRP